MEHCAAMWCTVMHCNMICISSTTLVLRTFDSEKVETVSRVAMCCGVLQCVAVCYSEVNCASDGSVLQCVVSLEGLIPRNLRPCSLPGRGLTFASLTDIIRLLFVSQVESETKCMNHQN